MSFSMRRSFLNSLQHEDKKWIIMLRQQVHMSKPMCRRILAVPKLSNFTITMQARQPHTLCNYSRHITVLIAAWAPHPPMIPHKCRLSITKLISQKLDEFKKTRICSSVTEAYCPLWWCMGGYQMPSWVPHSRWKKIGCGL